MYTRIQYIIEVIYNGRNKYDIIINDKFVITCSKKEILDLEISESNLRIFRKNKNSSQYMLKNICVINYSKLKELLDYNELNYKFDLLGL